MGVLLDPEDAVGVGSRVVVLHLVARVVIGEAALFEVLVLMLDVAIRIFRDIATTLGRTKASGRPGQPEVGCLVIIIWHGPLVVRVHLVPRGAGLALLLGQ